MKNPLKAKSKILGLMTIKISDQLKEKKQYILSDQIFRSWTSIWALIREAEYAQSKADLKSKLYIALKEANETSYWIELIEESTILKVSDEYKNILQELIKMLVSSIKTLQN